MAKKETQQKAAKETAHYWIYKAGKDIWNQWAAEAFDAPTRQKLQLPQTPLTHNQKNALLSTIQKHIPSVSQLPSPTAKIDFSHTIWQEKVNFSGYVFGGETTFGHAEFKKWVTFDGAYFRKWAGFYHIHFGNRSVFHYACFEKGAKFDHCKFVGDTSFYCSTFNAVSSFKHARFKQSGHFNHTVFDKGVYFTNSRFSKGASFENAKFNQSVVFLKTHFREVPIFKGITLNGALNFYHAQWPQAGQRIDNADKKQTEHNKDAAYSPTDEILAWAQLKAEMNRLHMHEEELFFFSKELNAKLLYYRGSRKWLIYWYKVFANYGQSALLPLIWLLVIGILSVPLYKFGFYANHSGWSEALYSAIHSSFPLLPVDKKFLDTLDLYHHHNAEFDTLSTSLLMLMKMGHSIISTILLFLVGLGIRNRLRIK